MKKIIYTMVLAVTGILWSTTLVPLSIEELTDVSGYVLRGRVTSISTYQDNSSGVIYRDVSIIPEDIYKGDIAPNSSIHIRAPGGTIGENTVWVPGTPEFTEGEDVLLFLLDNQDNTKKVVGLAQGKFSIINTSFGLKAIRSLDDVTYISPEGKVVDFRSSYDFAELVNMIRSRTNSEKGGDR